MREKIRKLERNIKKTFPNVVVSMEKFPSGSFFLNINTKQGFVVLEYSHEQKKYAVSKMTEPEQGYTGHDHVFSHFEEAAKKIDALLSALTVTPVKHMAKVRQR